MIELVHLNILSKQKILEMYTFINSCKVLPAICFLTSSFFNTFKYTLFYLSRNCCVLYTITLILAFVLILLFFFFNNLPSQELFSVSFSSYYKKLKSFFRTIWNFSLRTLKKVLYVYIIPEYNLIPFVDR